MTICIWNGLKNLGYLMLPYTFIRVLGYEKSAVLMQIIAEYNHAHNKKLNYFCTFYVDPERMSFYLAMTEERLFEILMELEQQGFIIYEKSDVQGLICVLVDEYKIIEFKQAQEAKNRFDDWDMGLSRCQNPINRINSFAKSIQKLTQFVDNFFNDINHFPVIIYQICNSAICEYEKDGKNFWNILNIKENLARFLFSMDEVSDDLVGFVKNQCEK